MAKIRRVKRGWTKERTAKFRKTMALRRAVSIKKSPYITDERVMVRLGNRIFTCKRVPMNIYVPIGRD